ERFISVLYIEDLPLLRYPCREGSAAASLVREAAAQREFRVSEPVSGPASASTLPSAPRAEQPTSGVPPPRARPPRRPAGPRHLPGRCTRTRCPCPSPTPARRRATTRAP